MRNKFLNPSNKSQLITNQTWLERFYLKDVDDKVISWELIDSSVSDILDLRLLIDQGENQCLKRNIAV